MPTKFVTNPRRPAAKKARPAAKKSRVPMRRNYASITPANNFLRDLRPAQVAQMVREGSLAVTHADIGNGYYTVTLFDDGVGGENRKRVEAKWFVDGEDGWYDLVNDITNGKVDPSTADLFLGPSRWDKREREEQTRAAAKRKGIDIDASRHYFNNPTTAAKATRAPSVASLSAKVVRLAKKHGPSHPLTVEAREEFEVAARAREGKRQSRMPVEAQMWAGMLAKRNPSSIANLFAAYKSAAKAASEAYNEARDARAAADDAYAEEIDASLVGSASQRARLASASRLARNRALAAQDTAGRAERARDAAWNAYVAAAKKANPRRKNPPKGFRIAGPAVKTMVDGLRISKADAQKLKDMMDTGAPRILQTADKMMNGHGVERISGVGGGLMYVNMGDTYDTTLIYDYKTNRFVVSSWGDIVERQPRRFAD